MYRGVHLLCLLALAAALAACGAPQAAPTPTAPAELAPNAQPSAEEPVTISFGAGEYERGAYQPLIDEFQQANPHIRVQFVSLDEIFQSQSGAFDAAAIARQVVSAADTAAVWSLDEQAVSRGYYRDLAPLIEADPDFDREDFFPGALAAAQAQGGTFMVPRDMYLSLLSYNKDLWAARGLPAPAPDWSWADLVAAAEQLASKRGDTVDVHGLVDWGGLTVLSGELAQTDPRFTWGEQGQAQLDRPEVVAALERLLALRESGAVMLPDESTGGDDIRTAIMEQRVGMWSSGMLWSDPNDPPGFAIGTAALPPLGPLPTRYVQGYVMSAGTQHPEAAWAWLSFLSRQPVTQPGAEGRPEQIPARRSVAEASGYWSGLDDEARAAVQALLDQPGGAPSVPDQRVYDPLSRAIRAAVAGDATPAAALADAQAAYGEALVQAQQTPTVTTAGPIVVATPQPAVVAAEGATAVTFFAGWDDGSFRRMVEQFNREQREVFVTLSANDPGAEGPQSLEQVAAAADVFFWYGLPQEGEPITATLDLQPLIDADPSFPRDDYPAGVLARFARQGAQYGLPYAVTLRTLAYNADAFADAGLEPPRPGWTLLDFVAAAEGLSAGEGQERRYGFGENSTQTLQFFLDAAGARLTGGEGGAPTLTDPKVVAATQQYVAFARCCTPDENLSGYTPSSWSDSYQLRQEGRVAMWFAYGLNRWELAEGAPFAVGVTAPPLLADDAGADAYWGSGLFISAETQHVEAAWQFVSWMSGRLDALQGGFPARISLAESPEFARQAPEGAAEVYAAYRELLERRPDESRASGVDWSRFDPYWYHRAVDRAIDEPGALDRELAAAQELTEQFAACVAGGEQAAACARLVDPEYEGFSQPAP